MPTHNNDEPGHGLWQEPEDHSHDVIDSSKGYEASDVKVTGIIVFLTALSIFVVVASVLSYGIGKVLFSRMAKEDGPTTHWQKGKIVDVRGMGDLVNNPDLQNKFAKSTEQFPAPRLQTDDGNQEIADLHEKEDLLLEHYSWVDQSQGKVRIPIERAMQLVARQGLLVAPSVQAAPLLTGDAKPVVAVPLTSGFAKTGYEHDRDIAEAVEGRRTENIK